MDYGVPETNITVMPGKLTASAITAEITSHKNLTLDDTLIFYYVGRGYYDSVLGTFLRLSGDTVYDRDNGRRRYADSYDSYIYSAKIAQLMKNSSAGQTIEILDCCLPMKAVDTPNSKSEESFPPPALPKTSDQPEIFKKPADGYVPGLPLAYSHITVLTTLTLDYGFAFPNNRMDLNTKNSGSLFTAHFIQQLYTLKNEEFMKEVGTEKKHNHDKERFQFFLLKVGGAMKDTLNKFQGPFLTPDPTQPTESITINQNRQQIKLYYLNLQP